MIICVCFRVSVGVCVCAIFWGVIAKINGREGVIEEKRRNIA